MRRSRTVPAAVSTALRAASSQDSVFTPINLALINAVMHVIRAEAEVTSTSSGARARGLSLDVKATWQTPRRGRVALAS